MKSFAHIGSHPLHPILVSFPIALLTGALLFDLGSLLLNLPELHLVAGWLLRAGIFMGFVAAVPGLLDLVKTVPPQSSAKKRGVRHGLVNAAALVVFIAALLLRGREGAGPGTAALALELAGAALLSVGGWLGGTLVYRNQIGVDIRYAAAGKWQEVHLQGRPGQPVEAAKSSDLETDQVKLLHVNGKRIVLARSESGYTAFDDRCTHRGGSLAAGTMICGTVQCPWHGSQFDTKTGQVKARPAKSGIKTYVVEEREGKVFVTL